MIHDISRPIHPGMAIYPGNPPVIFECVQEATLGASALTRLSLGSHTGTHIDAPSHIQTGAAGVETYALEAMIGPCQVIDLSHILSTIQGGDVPAADTKRMIIKTKNSEGEINVFDPNFVALDESAARELISRRIQLVGIDGPSIKKKGAQDHVHELLLNAGIVIVEGLWLKDVPAGDYELLCLPLAFTGIDGAPARAILRNSSYTRPAILE